MGGMIAHYSEAVDLHLFQALYTLEYRYCLVARRVSFDLKYCKSTVCYAVDDEEQPQTH